MARATAASDPPTMIDRVALRAPMSPPETGASTLSAPLTTAASASRRAKLGGEVPKSTSNCPGCSRGSTPLAPK